MKPSVFYFTAYDAMRSEIDRLNAFTDSLDGDTEGKQEQIADYKCAKYRYAAICHIHSALYNCYRLRSKLQETHYILPPFHEMLCRRTEWIAAYEALPHEEHPDAGLYYGMLALCDTLITEKAEKLPRANDWERIELEEYLDGFRFARACLEKAWEKRREGHE